MALPHAIIPSSLWAVQSPRVLLARRPVLFDKVSTVASLSSPGGKRALTLSTRAVALRGRCSVAHGLAHPPAGGVLHRCMGTTAAAAYAGASRHQPAAGEQQQQQQQQEEEEELELESPSPTTAATGAGVKGLPAPPEKGEPASTTVTLNVGGTGVRLDVLGPLVVNRDGSTGRVANWAEMNEHERATTLKLLSKRNRQRLDTLKRQDDGSN